MFTARRLVPGLLILAIPIAAHAAEIWSSGPNDIIFTKANGADPTLPANQDQITPDVAITRGGSMGIYNAVTETGFNVENGDIDVDNVSPEDTEWAFSGLNGNPTFDYGTGAADYGDLSFADWETASVGMNTFPGNLLENAAVMHVISDDIYIDVQFLSWGVGKQNDNSFSYKRAVAPVPEPASLAGLGLMSLALLARRRRGAGC